MAWLYHPSYSNTTTDYDRDYAGVCCEHGTKPFSATIVQNRQVSFSTQHCVGYADSNALLGCHINEDYLAEEIIVLVPTVNCAQRGGFSRALRTWYPMDQMQSRR
jgi:hypothetical protein